MRFTKCLKNQLINPFATLITLSRLLATLILLLSKTYLSHNELVQLVAVLELGVTVEEEGGVVLCSLPFPAPNAASQFMNKVSYSAVPDISHTTTKKHKEPVLRIRLRDPVPCRPLDPGWVKKTRIRIRNEQPGSYFREHRNSFWVKIHKFLTRIQDGKNSDSGWKKLGSGINIPDPQHCKEQIESYL
jgi:hypothetical protein